MALVALLAGCNRPSLNTVEGTTSSGGGGSIELEFKMIGRAVERRIRERSPKLHREFNFTAWKEALERASAVPIHHVPTHNGKPVDALNYPDLSLVEVFAERWAVLNAWERERLVTHEVFGLARMDDRGYRRTDNVLRMLESISVLHFSLTTLDGPSAMSLAENLDWEGARVATLPGWLFPDKKPHYLVSLLLEGQPLLHCIGGISTPLPAIVPAKTPVNLESPNCLLHYEGMMHGGHTLVFYSEHRNTQAKFKEMWRRLGGNEKAGFSHPSLLGIQGEEGFQSEIRIQVELRH